MNDRYPDRMNRLLALLPFCAALAAGCDGSADPAADRAARAYLQQVQAQPRPSAEEVHKFYAQHPELFAQRRLFTLEEIEVTREASLATALQERAARAASMDEIADWLRLREI